MKHFVKAAFTLFLTAVVTLTYAQNTGAAPLKWYTIEEAIALNQKTPKKIFIDVYTDWCGWCKVMDQKTFSHPYIAKYLTDNYYPVKFNAEQKGDVEFKGKVYKFVASGNRGYHELAAYLLNGQLSYPTVVYLNENMDLLTPVPGFYEPQKIEPILKYFGSNVYLTTKYEDYVSTFKSEIN